MLDSSWALSHRDVPSAVGLIRQRVPSFRRARYD